MAGYPSSGTPLEAFTPDELGAYVDTHVVMALEAADMLTGSRDLAEDYVRDRLVAASDTWPDASSLAAERHRATFTRLRAMLAEADKGGV